MATFEDLVRAIVREELASAGTAPVAAPAAAPKRGRGRPVAGETPPAAAPAPAPAVVEADPFATPAALVATPPAATLDQVRNALKELSAATTQTNAVGVLKAASGVDNLSALKADQFGAVYAAAKAAIPAAPAPAPAVEADPFETPAEAAPAVVKVTLEQIKAATVAAQKRTATDTVQAVVMKHGGTAPKPDGTGHGPSLKAIPEANYGAVLAALNALPATK
jgi:hypothetical protein